MNNIETLKFVPDLVKKMLIQIGLNPNEANIWDEIIASFLCVIIAYLLFVITKWIFSKVMNRISKKTKTNLDDLLVENKVFVSMAEVIPLLFIYIIIPITFRGALLISFLEKSFSIIIIVVILRALSRFTKAINIFYKHKEGGSGKPIQVVFQLVNVICDVLGALLVVSILIDKPIGGLLAGIGAFMAVIILIFKDTILGFVAGFQLSSNDQLKVGDWISVPKFGADGNVEEMSLYSVKIRNWDNTLTSVPPYALQGNAFQNWRGMQESGGRRIKRAIYININSVKFCTDDMIKKYSEIDFLRDYLENAQKNFDKKGSALAEYIPGLAKKQTNIGVFRAYIQKILERNPEINKDLTCMCRQLQPTEKGIPLEIYCFTYNKDWVYYENVQSDLIDHILAMAKYFDLEFYQLPSQLLSKN